MDFRELFEGAVVPFNGTNYLISEIHYVRRGWVRVIGTLDGEGVILHRTCGCDRPDGEIPVIDFVTETEYLCCASCRATIDD